MSVIQGNAIESGLAAYEIPNSLKFNSADSAYLDRSVATSGNLRKWTVSCWVKRGTLSGSADRYLFTQTNEDGSGADIKYTIMRFTTADKLELADRWASAGDEKITTTAVFRDPSAWYHVVFVRDSDNATAADRAIIYVNGVRQNVTGSFTQSKDSSWNKQTTASYGQEVSGRFRFAGSWYYGSDFYLSEVHSIDGQALDPTSFGEYNSETGVWQPIAYAGTYGTNGFYLNFSDNSAATPAGLGKDYSGMAGNIIVGTSTSGSTTLSVVSLTGISVGNIVTGPGIPDNTYVVSTGALSVTLSQAATSSNTSTNYTFSGNNWTPNNFSVTAGAGNDSMVDTPTPYGTDTGVGAEVRGNYATLNPTWPSTVNVTDGNLKLSMATNNRGAVGTMSIPVGSKIYFEATITDPGSYDQWVGIIGPTATVTNTRGDWNNTTAYGLTHHNSSATLNPITAGVLGSSVGTPANGDVFGVAVDRVNNEIKVYQNNNLRTTISISATETYFPACGVGGGADANTFITFNFGQRPFAYAAPSGYKSLCTTNLPDPAIADGSTAFNAVLWTGDGTSSRSFTGWGFAPDFIWMKNRSGTADHALIDIVRGTGAKVLSSNQTYAENDYGLSVTSFDSDGFTGATGSINFSYANINSGTYVGWGWKAGGTGVSNTDGSITSTVSANPTAGFSIVTYTGTGSGTPTVGHGLGVAPSMIIIKSRSNTANWGVGHVSAGWSNAGLLNATNSFGGSSYFASTAPTSTVFSIQDTSVTNIGSATYVAYCFAPVESYSAFGSYQGNGSSDGPFVYTGFRPAFILLKSSTAAESWEVMDDQRAVYNGATGELRPNLSNAETTGNNVDFLSNGFKIRTTAGQWNTSGATYIYAAFAENPFKYSLAR